MLIVRPPSLLTRALHRMTWDFSGDGMSKEVYLTFDDGPTPGVTPWVLDRLDEAGAKATFFCLGRNVDKYPGLYNQILIGGTLRWQPQLQPPERIPLQHQALYGRYQPGRRPDRFKTVPAALRADLSRVRSRPSFSSTTLLCGMY